MASPMRRTTYGYTSPTEFRCCGELESWMKEQRQKKNNRCKKNLKRNRKEKHKHVK
ncbi:hypothetical protein [Liquorilactobacillus sp.]|uniref:hypothetical protein n=1 Tax=Liquorilactobacillus sp. TaxID=2767923 RepID=UPI0039ED8D2A